MAGARWLRITAFISGTKYAHPAAELLTRIRLPRSLKGPKRPQHYYRKVGTRRAQAIAKVCFAASAA
jgi:CO/xanthine dehydrogenase FAD-binding subunit